MCKAFEGVVLWLLRVENIFGFSQTTFNLALTIFSRFILSVKVRRSLMDGDRCWGAERELCSHCCLRGDSCQMSTLSLIR